ncbi:Band 7 family protein [Seminavis robusta]|uniref:Band 7 family protein n=1 Tax=Seminavis robusta TaxID=568900 RepID=A0A9N8HAS9_9STRA|nr:Band 7 family protein [Seminavis robusta]|eukprot:Sro252_g099600.1 Band 7 family protein (412) ;mRNA; f:29027-30262
MNCLSRTSPRAWTSRLLLLSTTSSSRAGIRRRRVSTTTAVHNVLRPSRKTQRVLMTVSGTSLLALWCAKQSLQVVSTGQVAVEEYWSGRMNPTLLSAGTHVVHPWSKLTRYSLQPRHCDYEFNNMVAQNGLPLTVQVTIVYKLKEDKIPQLYVECGPDHDFHMPAMAKSILQSIISKISTRDLRRTHQQAVSSELQTKLTEAYQDFLTLELVVVKDMALPEHCAEGQKELDRLFYLASAEHQKAHVQGVKARSIANYHAAVTATKSTAGQRLNNENKDKQQQQSTVVKPRQGATKVPQQQQQQQPKSMVFMKKMVDTTNPKNVTQALTTDKAGQSSLETTPSPKEATNTVVLTQKAEDLPTTTTTTTTSTAPGTATGSLKSAETEQATMAEKEQEGSTAVATTKTTTEKQP